MSDPARVSGQGRQGVALLVALASLAVLSLLAVSFASLTRLESAAGSSEVDSTRARMVAQAGIEFAAARLLDDAGRPGFARADASWRHGDGPLETTPEPSYRGGQVAGWTYSGVVGGTWTPRGDHFVLSIEDCSASIDLNAPMAAMGAILDRLGAAIREERIRRGRTALDPVRGRGAEIVRLRERHGGFRSLDPLREILDEADLRALAPYVTLHGWTDPHTIAPTGARREDGTPDFVLQPRAPVHLNAAPRPVLIALLAGLRGPVGGGIPFPVAARIADLLIERREDPLPGAGPFDAWPEVYDFVLSLARGPQPVLTEEWAWAILANADPNLHPARLNLEAVVAPPFDKSELLHQTTEFTLRSPGLFRIDSLGRVLGPDGEVRSHARVRAVVRVFGMLYHTVQADFERHRASDRSENATTFPNPFTGAGPAAWAGHVQLQTDRPAGGLAAEPVFEALFRDSLAAERGGAPEPSTEQAAGLDVLLGSGDLFPDGLFFSPDRGRLSGWVASDNVPLREGALEFWVKFDRQTSTAAVPLVLLGQPMTDSTGVQHLIRARLDRGNLVVESTRAWYVAECLGDPVVRAALPSPFRFEETTWTAVLPGRGRCHEWHHVAVSWFDGTSQTVSVDGLPGVLVSATPATPTEAIAGWPPHRDLLVVGGSVTDERGREVAPATIDDVRIYERPLAPIGVGVLRSRFEPASLEYTGRFAGAFAPQPRPIRLLSVHWTEWIPRTYNGLPLPNLPLAIDLGLDVGGGPVDVLNGATADLLELLGLAVLVESREIRYEIRFRCSPALVPLNVTPILDDLVVLYRPSRPEFHEYRWLPDE